jgi:hypothetical protein
MITINLDKAKNIAHDIRRAKRAEEFAPLDIKATIPSEAVTAEAERQVIRNKYAAIQENINAATNTEQLKSALG